jgi:hypothetical protein
MNDDFLSLPKNIGKQSALEIKKCNDYTAKFGVTLTDSDIACLMESRNETLKTLGRIEFGNGILQKLIFQFCDSAYIYQDNYVETLLALQETFYYYKNEALDEITDDELISIMKEYFETECQGSTTYLQETTLEDICRNVRYGYGIIRSIDEED